MNKTYFQLLEELTKMKIDGRKGTNEQDGVTILRGTVDFKPPAGKA